MCEFVSWITIRPEDYAVDGKLSCLYLTAKDLKSSRGKKLAKEIGDDINGHGAIRRFYDLKDEIGTNRECTDFSSPFNFPTEIAKAIRDGEFRGFGVNYDLLTANVLEEFLKITHSAFKEYEKIDRPAHKKYMAIKEAAWADYTEINKKLFVYKKGNWEEYNKMDTIAFGKYISIQDPAWREYISIKNPAWNKYYKTSQKVFWDFFAVLENRAKAWR